jgi:hypothetical protein
MDENTTQNQNQNPSNQKPKKRIKFIVIILLAIIVFGSFAFYSLYSKYVNQQVVDYGAASAANYYDIDFSIRAYDKIDADYKSCIQLVFSQNEYINGLYFLTKIPSRASKVFAFGDFSRKENGEKEDLAILIEKNDFRSSRLFILSNNCSVIYSKDYDYELPTISAFKKGQKIFLGDTKLVISPTDGIMLHFKGHKTALLYIPESKTFEEFPQYSDGDLKSMEEERNGEGEYAEGEEENTQEPQSNNPTQADSIAK